MLDIQQEMLYNLLMDENKQLTTEQHELVVDNKRDSFDTTFKNLLDRLDWLRRDLQRMLDNAHLAADRAQGTGRPYGTYAYQASFVMDQTVQGFGNLGPYLSSLAQYAVELDQAIAASKR